ncbi:MAG: hypothetical protein VYE15_07280 [Myxococcota bacterium]|nr:hypothetical protein [Myxococcota bacterium]
MSEPQPGPDLLKLIKLNPLRISYISGGAALVMGSFDMLVHPFFRVDLLGWFVLPLWIPCAIYAGLQYFIWAQTEAGLTLGDAELEEWGEMLEKLTPEIMEALKRGDAVATIADSVQEDHGVPNHITLRYVVALGRHLGAE